MTPGARLRAATEVLEEVLNRHRPIASALSDWRRGHRFAGSGDNAAIGNLVYDAMRQRRSVAARLGGEAPRALVLGVAAEAFSVSPDRVIAMADGSRHALDPVTDAEAAAIHATLDDSADLGVRADVPDWLLPQLKVAFGDDDRVALEGRAFARRAPLDIRVNTLKADREKTAAALVHTDCVPTQLAPHGLRIPAQEGSRRLPNVEAEGAHGRGWFEIQDESSQLAAALAGAGPRMQVLDLCAGAGGKTLALGADMQNTGQLYAYDHDKQQLRPIFDRIRRAGLRSVQVIDAGREEELDQLGARFDVVFVDAPCSGSGTWRRRPDAKWRLTPKQLNIRIAEQRRALERAAGLVAPGGRLVYATCSVLPSENAEQVAWFRDAYPAFEVASWVERWSAVFGQAPDIASVNGDSETLLLSPGQHETDGFFVAFFNRRA